MLKKKTIGVLIAIFMMSISSFSVKAQNPEPGDHLLSIGLGYGFWYGGLGIPVSYEIGVGKLGEGTLMVGPTGGLSIGSVPQYYDINKDKVVNEVGIGIGVGGIITWHYDFNVPKFDSHIGTGFGVAFGVNDAGRYYRGTYFFPVFSLGATYYFAPKTGVYIDLGYNAISTAGIGIKFKL